jgi:hypothetical protein
LIECEADFGDRDGLFGLAALNVGWFVTHGSAVRWIAGRFLR